MELQLRLARLAAIEKAKCKYLRLSCGHYQTLETFDTYLVFRPRRGYTFCENCNKMRAIAKPPKRAPIPQEPMF